MTRHGPHTPCPLPSTSTFLQKYLSLADGSREKAAYERRYGAKQLAKMVSDWHEAEGNRKWMEDRTRVCPGCQGRIEKSVGCNHMICSRWVARGDLAGAMLTEPCLQMRLSLLLSLLALAPPRRPIRTLPHARLVVL